MRSRWLAPALLLALPLSLELLLIDLGPYGDSGMFWILHQLKWALLGLVVEGRNDVPRPVVFDRFAGRRGSTVAGLPLTRGEPAFRANMAGTMPVAFPACGDASADCARWSWARSSVPRRCCQRR